MGAWLKSESRTSCEQLSPGGTVLLKYRDAYDYAIFATIISVSNDLLELQVTKVCDWYNRLDIHHADALRFENEIIKCDHSLIHEVRSRT